MSPERAAIVAEARRYIGTPWEHRGRAPGRALDCAGVLICVARARGLVAELFDVSDYSTNPDGTLLERLDSFMGGRVPRHLMAPGDALVVRPDRYPQHLGVIGDYRAGGLSLIHASNATSVVPARVIETRLMFSRALKFVAAYRFPGVAA